MKNQILFAVGGSVLAGVIAYMFMHESTVAPEVAPVRQVAAPAAAPILASPVAAKPTPEPAPVFYASRLPYDTASFKGAPLPERLAAMSLRRGGRAFRPEEVAAALKSDEAWSNDASIAGQLNLSKEEQRDGREFIRVNPIKFEALLPGDELNLTLKQVKADGPLRLVVDRVEGSGENVTWHGHLKDFGSENQVSFTRGKSLIVGSISVPDKSFAVQIMGDVGWVVDGFTIFKVGHDDVQPINEGTVVATNTAHNHKPGR